MKNETEFSPLRTLIREVVAEVTTIVRDKPSNHPKRCYPQIECRALLERLPELVAESRRVELLGSGASAEWHFAFRLLVGDIIDQTAKMAGVISDPDRERSRVTVDELNDALAGQLRSLDEHLAAPAAGKRRN